MDGLAPFDPEGFTPDLKRKVRLSHQMHLDAAELFVEVGPVFKLFRVDLRAGFIAETIDEILVEGSRDAGSIVVRCLENLGILRQVDSDQQISVLTFRKSVLNRTQDSHALNRIEVSE